MAQFDVYPNPNPASRDDVPFLVDVQSDLLSDLRTRLTVPLTRLGLALSHQPRRLTPQFTVLGERVVLFPFQAAGLDARLLRKPVASLAAQAGEIRDALDAVVSGI